MTAAVLTAAALVLTGCASNDPLAQQYRDGSDKNYVAGDGSIMEVSPADRDAPITFEGTTELGESVSSEDYLGEVLVVNFWASYCGPCRVEAPDLEKVSQEWAGKGASFLGINTYDGAEQALAFSRKYGVSYPSVLDAKSGEAQLAFAGKVPPSALPTTLVLDREGRVAARILGQVQAASILDALIETVAAEET